MVVKKMIYIDNGEILFICEGERYYSYRYEIGDINYHNDDISIKSSSYSVREDIVYVTAFSNKYGTQMSKIFPRRIEEVKDLTDYLHLII